MSGVSCDREFFIFLLEFQPTRDVSEFWPPNTVIIFLLVWDLITNLNNIIVVPFERH